MMPSTMTTAQQTDAIKSNEPHSVSLVFMSIPGNIVVDVLDSIEHVDRPAVSDILPEGHGIGFIVLAGQ